MTYLIQGTISANGAMNTRVAQCLASQPNPPSNVDQWAHDNRRTWAAAPGWDTAWVYAVNTHPELDYDPGTDQAVITDQMILSQVQLMLSAPVIEPQA